MKTLDKDELRGCLECLAEGMISVDEALDYFKLNKIIV